MEVEGRSADIGRFGELRDGDIAQRLLQKEFYETFLECADGTASTPIVSLPTVFFHLFFGS